MALGIGAGTAEEFFSSELSKADLKDKRLVNRAQDILVALQKNLTCCIRRLYTNSSQARQAYDFFSNPKIKKDNLLSAHYEQTAERIHAHTESEYLLLIQDGMRLNYTNHLAKTEIGRIGKANNKDQYGLIQHSTLCVTENNEPLGLIDAQFFHYDEFDTSTHHHHREIGDKVSKCWLDALKYARERIGSCPQKLVMVADRESDIFEFLHELVDAEQHFVIRSKHNRYTGETHRAREKKCRALLEKSQVIGQITRTIQDVSTREMKEIQLDIKAISITLPPPNKSKTEKSTKDYAPITINLVQACSDTHEWVLLTSLPITTLKEAVTVIDIYRTRWHIEDYHKVLKTGYQVDEIYLHSSRESLENMLMMASISACRLYWLIYKGRAEEKIKADVLFSEFEWKSIYVYWKEKVPEKVPELKEVILRIARLGGYKPRKKASPPGIKTMWIGFQKFSVAANMYENAMSTKT